MVKIVKYTFFIFLLFNFKTFSQVGIGTEEPSEKARLEIQGWNEDEGVYRGFLPPRVPSNTERDLIDPDASDNGLMVYVNDSKCIEIWDGSSWIKVKCDEDLPYANDLFISEYVEGDGFNKAIEIANFTGGDIDLADYELRIRYDTGATNSTIDLSGILSHGKVYVVAHSESDAALLIKADQTASNMNFNGNDEILLRTSDANNTVIDRFGYENVNCCADTTFRKSKSYGPSTTFIIQQFKMYPINTFDGLGWHDYFE